MRGYRQVYNRYATQLYMSISGTVTGISVLTAHPSGIPMQVLLSMQYVVPAMQVVRGARTSGGVHASGNPC